MNAHEAAKTLGYVKIEAEIYVGDGGIIFLFADGSTKLLPASSKTVRDLHQASETMKQLEIFNSRKGKK